MPDPAPRHLLVGSGQRVEIDLPGDWWVRVLDLSRTSRLVTTGLWSALVLRDQHCSFPAAPGSRSPATPTTSSIGPTRTDQPGQLGVGGLPRTRTLSSANTSATPSAQAPTAPTALTRARRPTGTETLRRCRWGIGERDASAGQIGSVSRIRARKACRRVGRRSAAALGE